MNEYLDTSSLVKRYVEERGSGVIDRLYEETEAGRATTSYSIWNIGEALGVLDRYRTRGMLTGEELQTTLRSLTSETMKMIRLGTLQLLPMTSRNPVGIFKALIVKRLRQIPSDRELYRRPSLFNFFYYHLVIYRCFLGDPLYGISQLNTR